jgi:hypothetical protein
VIDVDDTVLWDGVIQLEYERNWTTYSDNASESGQQAVLGYWVHGLQQAVYPEQWAGMFFAHHRAIFELGPNQQARQHPFEGPAIEMETRLRALNEDVRHNLYQSALYPWLYFYSNGEYYSLLKEWKFALDEISAVIGLTDQQLATVKTAYRLNIPFNWPTFIRFALLFRVHGALKWRFPHTEDGITWLNDGSPSPKTLLLQGDILQVHNLLTIQ